MRDAASCCLSPKAHRYGCRERQAAPEVPPRFLSADGSARGPDAEADAPRAGDPIVAPGAVARVPSGANLAPIGSSLSSRSSSVLDGPAPQARPWPRASGMG